MNNGQQGGPPQGQPSASQQQLLQQQQQQRKFPMFKPEQMRGLPDPITAEERNKWEAGLRSLWSSFESNGPETQAHQDAKRKILEFSRNLATKLQVAKNQKAQQQQHSMQSQPGQQTQQGEQAGGARPSSQGQQPQQNPGGENVGGNSSSTQQKQAPRISSKLLDHVGSFPYVLPPNMTPGTADATKYLGDIKQRYLKALVNMENCSARATSLDALVSKRIAEGKPLTPEEEKDIKEKKDAAYKSHNEAKVFVDQFRNQQAEYRKQQSTLQASAQGNGPSASGGQSSIGNNGGQGPPTRPQMNPQQVPNPTQTVNAAIEAARAQQMGGGRPNISGQQPNGQMSQAQQIPDQNSQSGVQQGPMANIKTEAGLPAQNNSAITQMQGNPRQPMQNNAPSSAVPRSAGAPQSATTQGQQQQQIPQALSHADAISQANRSYSNTQPSNVMGHSHPTAPRETNAITNKMPIPKHLPERATQPPAPVAMQQARPTFSGGPSNVGSVISQPVIPKMPGFSLDGDGDRVLSKKKLDELVRQVTGGGQGGLDGGEGLTPDVEESILNVADNFVDQVLAAACKNAKERGSKVLEIRDIQLTLERAYNIRIPGYSSDEIRTVRKIQPSPGWISKMSAVQAAKVTGGKNSD
ncbi:hypothetical protein QTJ16_004527 [Diplocarpon rosae]|uniref:Transcription initiation factor TFIID subunit 12 domain-containing protein n=1 Tax=Diplocarpon rosae TaxID=946125 RepID=A0AAD9WCG8_9HELO|nr:hypothetical protein QTJ16_004527 [Diplocarpon rosae]